LGGFAAASATASGYFTMSGIPALDSILVSFALYLAAVRAATKLSQRRGYTE
jgi:hypothetical protein